MISQYEWLTINHVRQVVMVTIPLSAMTVSGQMTTTNPISLLTTPHITKPDNIYWSNHLYLYTKIRSHTNISHAKEMILCEV